MTKLFARIPKDRIAVLIGPNGSCREHIEKKLSVNLEINSETGDVEISLSDGVSDPSVFFAARDIVLAIGRGFSPSRAFRLLEDEETAFEIIDLREVFGKSNSNIRRVNGRIIGRDGKTRRLIEETSEASVSVYGHTVAIIGNPEQLEIARQAINLLIKGSPHSTVYKYLEKQRREMKKKKLTLWEDSSLSVREK